MTIRVVGIAAAFILCGGRPAAGQQTSRVGVFVEGGGTAGKFGPAYGGGVLATGSPGTHVQLRVLNVDWERRSSGLSVGPGSQTSQSTATISSGKTLVVVGILKDPPADGRVRLLFSCGGGLERYRRRDTVRFISSEWHPMGQDRTTDADFHDTKVAFYGELGMVADVREGLHVRGGVVLWNTLGRKEPRQYDSTLTLVATIGVGYAF